MKSVPMINFWALNNEAPALSQVVYNGLLVGTSTNKNIILVQTLSAVAALIMVLLSRLS
jgi:uncharacterized membrane protein